MSPTMSNKNPVRSEKGEKRQVIDNIKRSSTVIESIKILRNFKTYPSISLTFGKYLKMYNTTSSHFIFVFTFIYFYMSQASTQPPEERKSHRLQSPEMVMVYCYQCGKDGIANGGDLTFQTGTSTGSIVAEMTKIG